MLTKIKRWLERSGITYTDGSLLAPRHRFLGGTEMIDELNPFAMIIEDPKYPLARIYRESVWIGINDTWDILMGNHYDVDSTGRGRKGVLDLLIFPVIGRRLMGYSLEEDKNEFFQSFARVFACLLEIPRGILGLALTLALSPVVALVHCVAYFKSKRLYEEVAQLQVRDISEEEVAQLQVRDISEEEVAQLQVRDISEEEVAQVETDYHLPAVGQTSYKSKCLGQWINEHNQSISQSVPSTVSNFIICGVRKTTSLDAKSEQFDEKKGAGIKLEDKTESPTPSVEKKSNTREYASVGLGKNMFNGIPLVVIEETEANLCGLSAGIQLGLFIIINKTSGLNVFSLGQFQFLNLCILSNKKAIIEQREALNFLEEKLRSRQKTRQEFLKCADGKNKQGKGYDLCLMSNEQSNSKLFKPNTIYIKKLNNTLLEYAVRKVDSQIIFRDTISASQLQIQEFTDPVIPVQSGKKSILTDEIVYILSKKNHTQRKLPMLPSEVSKSILYYADLSP